MSTSSRVQDRVRQVAGVATLVVVLLLNGLAGSGGLSGASIGDIANRFSTWFLPASYVFSIWSVIYLLLLGFVGFQVLPSRRESAVLRRIGAWWPINGLLNVSWIVVFSFGLFGPSLAVMILLLGSLIVIQRAIGPRDQLGRVERFAVALPFEMYLAWISVALIANTFQFGSSLGWDGLGSTAAWVAVAMMVVATSVGAFMASRRGVWIYPFVVAWALHGIAVRYAGQQPVAAAGWLLAAIGLVVGAVALTRMSRGEVGA